MIPKKQLEQIKEELVYCKRPIFFFHDDPDGLCSFLLLYRFVGAGKGVAVKAVPRLTKDIFAKKAEEYGADKIFVLDLSEIEEDFVRAVKSPIIWIDHHDPVKLQGVKYFNPRVQNRDEYSPVSYWCYKVLERDLWIATVGCIGDAFIPPFFGKFVEQYPGLADIKTNDVLKIIYETELGKLVRIFSFSLLGSTKQTNKVMKVLTRIQTPYEILSQSTNQGKFIYKQFLNVQDEYQRIMAEAKKVKSDKNVFFFTYKSSTSLTKDIANELTYLKRDTVIIVGREKSGELKLSLRWTKNIKTPLQKALKHVQGYGGGHEKACGAVIKAADAETFISVIREEISGK
jgi:single-stranded DNA-specific DHH superfamily exonuclease